MAVGEVKVLGPFGVGDSVTITSSLSGVAVVADSITPYVSDRQVFFAVIKAA